MSVSATPRAASSSAALACWTSISRLDELTRRTTPEELGRARRTPRPGRPDRSWLRSAVFARGRLGRGRRVREVGRRLLARVFSRLLAQPSLADGVLAIDLR